MKQLILDLRFNAGGSLQDAVKLCSQFIPEKNQIIVSTKGTKAKEIEYKSTGQRFFPLENLVVLINEFTASSAEIVAGCMQDLQLATIIGSRSFGKGVVQEIFPLSDSTAISISVSEFMLPSGRSIQKPFEDARSTHEKMAYYKKPQWCSEVIEPDSVISFEGRSLAVHQGIFPDRWIIKDTMVNDFFQRNQKSITQEAFLIYNQLERELPEDPMEFRLPQDALSEAQLMKFLNGINAEDMERIETKLREEVEMMVTYFHYGIPTMMRKVFSSDEACQEAMSILDQKKLSAELKN